GSKEARGLPAVSNGMQVVATGAIGIWERSSEYQLRVLQVAPIGVGTIAAKVEALRKRLQAEGLFEAKRKRPLSRFPRRVALVSAHGKGAEDFETTLREKSPNVTVIFFPSRVQGDGAEIDLAEAIDRASRNDVDAIAVVRGGGSFEDRYPFNTEPVVRAIARSRHPVVTAIGHTGDRHLADEVADAVFKTPTAAAEHIAASWIEVIARISSQQQHLTRAVDDARARCEHRQAEADDRLLAAMEGALSRWGQRVLVLSRDIERQNPRVLLARREMRLNGSELQLNRAGERVMLKRTNELAVRKSGLFARNPQALLERGYAIVTHKGRALRDSRETAPGERIEVQLHRGKLEAGVERVVHDE
ncbi:MAG: exodeoxyribonuclease VII large subunit, partial [Candidatus Eremiobacteraeota bacterium]|nr:exodeoxyribonuclease VII large subunit [Candidatus Eremiobacteraeota bacterium]